MRGRRNRRPRRPGTVRPSEPRVPPAQARAVARLRRTYGSAEWAAQTAASVRVTRWLGDRGVLVTVPLDVEQPVEVDGWAVTFWHHADIDPAAPAANVVDLARALRKLHAQPAPPIDLPETDPLGSLPAEFERPGPLTSDQRDWLRAQACEVAAAYTRLEQPLSRGLVHGDARTGNLLPVGGGHVLGDWDSVSVGPRVQDLVPTVLGHRRLGRPREDWERLCEAYGVDVGLENHPAVQLLCRARELRTLAAYIRAAEQPDVAAPNSVNGFTH